MASNANAGRISQRKEVPKFGKKSTTSRKKIPLLITRNSIVSKRNPSNTPDITQEHVYFTSTKQIATEKREARKREDAEEDREQKRERKKEMKEDYNPIPADSCRHSTPPTTTLSLPPPPLYGDARHRKLLLPVHHHRVRPPFSQSPPLVIMRLKLLTEPGSLGR